MCSGGLVIQKVFLKVVIILKIIVCWSLSILKHVESNIVWIVIVGLKVVKLDLGILQPFISILKHLIIKTLEIFQLVLDMSKILFKDCLSGLFLDLEHNSHLLEPVLKLSLHLIRFLLELVVYLVDLLFIWLLLSGLGKVLVHFH
jgi:hypothetical protein